MPNEITTGSHFVQSNMAPVIASVGADPTTRGQSMAPHSVTQLLPGSAFTARGRGRFSLLTSVRFPRGYRMSGRQGTMDLFIQTGEQGQVAASGILTTTAVGLADGDTVTIDAKVYTFQDTLTDVNGNVHVGVDAAESLFNLVSAINLLPGSGTRYATAMTLHATVEAAGGPGLTMIATAQASGPGGNTLATTEVGPEASWAAATLLGGSSTASTLCYLTDDPENPQQALVVGLDSSNRPTLKLVNLAGASVTVAFGVLTLSGNVVDVAATATLTSSGQVNDGDTVTIDGKVYTFEVGLTNFDGNVDIGGTQALSMENLRRAINLDGVAGVDYAAAMTLHPTVSATDTATTVDITAKVKGEEANAIALTAISISLDDWDNPTMTGGTNDKVTIGTKTYKFQTALTNVDGNVLIGGSASLSLDNLIDAINLGPGSGVDYAAVTVLHPTVSVSAGAGDTMDALAKTPGVVGNSIVTTDPVDDGGVMSWGAATLVGGSGGPVTLAETIPTGAPLDDNAPVTIRMTWDSLNLVGGTARHASLRVNRELIATGDWSTDPTAVWDHFQPTHIVLGQGFDGAADFDGQIHSWQGSNEVLP